MAKSKTYATGSGYDFEQILEDVLNSLNSLPTAISDLADVIQRLSLGMSPLITALTNLFATFGAGHRVGPQQGQGTPNNPSGVGNLFPSGGAPGSGAGQAYNAAGPATSLAKVASVGAVAAAALAALAITVNLVEQKLQQLQQAVRMFNPGVIALFQQALDNLSATIGSAFVPMFQVATEVVRQWTRVLAPIMQQLAPMVRQFSEAFGNILVSVLIRLGAAFQSMLPVVKQMMEWFQMFAQAAAALMAPFVQLFRGFMLLARILYELSGMGLAVRLVTRAFEALSEILRVTDEALSILEVVITTLADAAMAFFESIFPIDKAMASLRNAIDVVIRNMYVFAVMLARLAGMDNVVDALISHVEGKLKPGATAAQQPQIKGLDQLAKDLALAAASAGGATGPGGIRNQQEFWQRTLEEMRAAKNNGVSIKDLLIEIKNAILRAFPDTKKAAAIGAQAIKMGAGGVVQGALVGEAAASNPALGDGVASGFMSGLFGRRR